MSDAPAHESLPLADSEGWHETDETPPSGRIIEIRLHGGQTYFAQWSEGRKMWVSTRQSVSPSEVAAWRVAPRLR